MAVQQGYGKMAGANSLVFAYDTADTKNSFKGAPTTNLIPGVANPTLSADGWVEHGWRGSIDIDEQENALVLTATNGWHSIAYDFGSLNAPITVSFKAKLKSKQTTTIPLHVLNGLHLGDYDQWLGSISTPTLTEYQEFVFTFTPTERALICLVLRGADTLGLTDEIYIKDLQVEQKSFKTAFVNGTRSATEGLIDLTGNTSINLSNVSFDSNAQMTYDGTNTSASITGLTISARENKTYEAVIKIPNNYSGIGAVLAGRTSITNFFGLDSGRRLRCGEDDQYILGNVALVSEIWYHVVYTFEFDGSTTSIQKTYVNGEIDNQVTQTNYTDGYIESTQYIGYESRYSYRFNGDISVLKVYNKTLTAAEVQANFNNYKTRFNIE